MVKIPVEYSRTDLHVKHRNDIKMYACMYVYVCSYGCIDVRVYVCTNELSYAKLIKGDQGL